MQTPHRKALKIPLNPSQRGIFLLHVRGNLDDKLSEVGHTGRSFYMSQCFNFVSKLLLMPAEYDIV